MADGSSDGVAHHRSETFGFARETTLSERSTARGDVDLTEGIDLVVVWAGRSARVPLPRPGTVLVGRSSRADVVIDAPRVSREHATIAVDEGGRLTIEDRASANGVFVHGARIAAGRPMPLAIGDVVTLGSARLIVVGAEDDHFRSLVFSHTRFEAAVEAACARARLGDEPLGLLRLRVHASARTRDAVAALSAAAGRGGIVGSYGPDELELAIVDRDLHAIEARLADVAEELRSAGIGASAGVAFVGADGHSAAELVQAACDRLEGGARRARYVHAEGAIAATYAVARQVAAEDAPCLVVGETGAGKQVLAEMIHEWSARRRAPFVVVDCATLENVDVALRAAGNGTLVLDEVAKLSPAMQPRLLHAVEHGPARVIATTSEDLSLAVGEGRFSSALLFRLGVFTIAVPPLRERRSEIPPLARALLEEASRRRGGRAPTIAPAALDILTSAAWPGNVRELRNVMLRAAVLSSGNTVTAEHLPIRSIVAPIASRETERLHDDVARVERERILAALHRAEGNQTAAARLLGISRGKLIQRITEYGVSRPRKGKG